MDELFDYLKSAKTNRKHLVTALIASEILGIIAFIWVLKEPLYAKFLQTQPRAYSLNQMNPQMRYLLTQNDYLHGLTKNSGKVIVLLSNGNQIEQKGKIRANENGEWYYQIPDSTEPGIKLLTAAELDETNNILSIKSYKVRVKPNDIISFNNQIYLAENPTISIEEITPAINLGEQSTLLPNINLTLNPPPQD